MSRSGLGLALLVSVAACSQDGGISKGTEAGGTGTGGNGGSGESIPQTGGSAPTLEGPTCYNGHVTFGSFNPNLIRCDPAQNEGVSCVPWGKCPSDASEEWTCDVADLQADAANCGVCGAQCAPKVLYQQNQWSSDQNLVSDGTRVFWLGQYDTQTFGVFSASLGGEEPMRLDSTRGSSSFSQGMAFSSGDLYWLTSRVVGSAVRNTIHRVRIDGGETTSVVEDQPPIHAFAVVGERVFWTADNDVMTAPVTGGSPTRFASVRGANSIAADRTNLYVAGWEIESDGTLYKVPLDGSSPVELAHSGSSGSFGKIAVDDHNHDHVYFIRFTQVDSKPIALIEKLHVSGGAIVSLAADVYQPASLAVDATHVYWAELGRESVVAGSIRKVPRAGGQIVTLATRQAEPRGLTLVGTNVAWVQTFYDFKLTTTAKEPCVSGVCSPD